MADAITVASATEKLNEVLRKIGQDLPRGAKTSLREWADYALKRFVTSRLSGGSGALQRRTGDLARSFRTVIQGDGMESAARFYTDSRYAKIHETGGTIRPRHARRLAVPVRGSPALTPAGRQRYSSPLRRTLPANYQFWIQRSDDGKLFLMGRREMTGKGRTKIQPWYQLVRSVTIRPRMHFADSMRLYVKVFKARLAAQARKVMGNG